MYNFLYKSKSPEIRIGTIPALWGSYQGLVISPIRQEFILYRISRLDNPCPKRNINLVMAHSGVLSYPLITPASKRCIPVS